MSSSVSWVLTDGRHLEGSNVQHTGGSMSVSICGSFGLHGMSDQGLQQQLSTSALSGVSGLNAT